MADEPKGVTEMYRPDPTSRHPLIVSLLLILFIIGLTILLGAPAPGSIEDQLDPLQVRLWGLGLGGGALIYLMALALQGIEKVKPFTLGVAFEQVGAAMLGVAAILYAVAIMVTVRWAGAVPAALVLVLGFFCIYRWISILRGIRQMSRRTTA